jgi:hypothetical protein
MKNKHNHVLVSSLLMTILCLAALALIAPLPGGGWWFGAQVQNVSSTPAAVTFTVYDYASGTTYQSTDSVTPGTYKLYQPTNFPGMPDNFQGSSIVSSNQDIRAIVNLTNRSAGGLGDPNTSSPAAGQYQGANVAGSPLYFPLVKNDYYGKTTTIIVQNVGTIATTASATFTFLSSPYTYYYYSTSINPHQFAVFDPVDARHLYNNIEYHPPFGNISSAVGSLTVTASQNLAGIALEHLVQEDHATLLQATRGFTSSDFATTVYAPINKNNYYHRFTGLQVQNVSSQSVTLNVTYKATSENANPPNNPLGCQGGTYSDSATVASGSSYTFNSTKLPDNCFASATIVATGGNVVAVVNEAFMQSWLNDHPGHANEATAYNAIPNGSVSKNLSVPLFKEDSYSKSTGLSIENVGAVKATNVVITLKGPTGTYVSNPISIDPGSAYVAIDLRLKPSAFWNGTALNPTVLGCQNNTTGCGANGVFSVIVNSDQNIVGVANESTYPIDYPRINQDKSNYEAFNLTQ